MEDITMQKIGREIGKMVMHRAKEDYKHSIEDAEIDSLKDNN